MYLHTNILNKSCAGKAEKISMSTPGVAFPSKPTEAGAGYCRVNADCTQPDVGAGTSGCLFFSVKGILVS